MNLVLYPKYTLFVSIYSIFLFIIGITYAKFIDNLLDDFREENNKKSKFIIWTETIAQVVLLVLGSYILREFIDYLFRNVFDLNTHIFGNPDRFAVIIVAPTMFFTQKNLQRKINYLWNIQN
jgi:hypothetical protein